MGTPGISYRKRFRHGVAGRPFHGRRGRGVDLYFATKATTQVLGLVALAKSLSVQLTWTPQSQADTYLVEKSANGTTGWTTVSAAVPRGSQGWLVPGLTASVAQFFRVSAVNELGAGAVSANATATPTA